ncbi:MULTISPECIES: hypothetical protein [Rhodopseudomonas]|uniref:hypothetical protein n=1 Tax=Rhodopseudomonas TaxID=1073 RepID=UPI0005C9B073|nr:MULTISPECIES: hypothetical protein [Rhodopseudomonas]MDF3808876.1 hypothetical protein [Rhodopseudomonas sp. BAL398]WOK15841.1 hypothetical protein RBJ75_16875 [Rhodopseudomonas sp. BAL398]
MAPVERFLVGLDSPPWSMAWRVALGLSMPPLLRAISGSRDRVWMDLALFLAILIALYLIPVVLRRLLPFSDEAKEIWSARRRIAKRHDSYQWQKLFWIGLGLFPYTVVGHGLGLGELLITLFCLLGGSAGLFFWSRMDWAKQGGG